MEWKKERKLWRKRILSLLLALAMILPMMPSLEAHAATKQVQEDWFHEMHSNYIGKKGVDIDSRYGYQCVDLADYYAEYIFGVSWRDSIGGVRGAKEIYSKASDTYFEKIPQTLEGEYSV